jgi:hypothetical protein
MNRAETQSSLQIFFDRLACVQVADPALGKAYVDALRAYVDQLAQGFDDIDQWTVEEYERVCDYVNNNRQWILHAEVALETLAAAYAVLSAHRQFLQQNGALEESLVRAPSPSYRHQAGALPAFGN